MNMHRRAFVQNTALGLSSLVAARLSKAAAATDLQPVYQQLQANHEVAVRRLQDWMKQPSIAAENRGMSEGCQLTMDLLKEVGFDHVTKVPTDGQPGVFATFDAGAPKTVGVYFMYDVKQVDPSEWSSPPFAAALVEKPGFGRCVVGRGAVNSKGPQSALLFALRALKAAGRKPPVNLVFVAEGEEEIGSPHFKQIVHRPDVLAAFKKASGVCIPLANQATDGSVTLSLGAKGVVELELVSSSEKWGRGPKADLHSSNEARVDSPAWHLVEALATLVGPDGHTPAVEGFFDKARKLTPAEKAMIREAAKRQSEDMVKKELGVTHWIHDVDYIESLELLASKPTINIEGLVGGYTGPGGKTILPHKAVAKIDMRIVPDMTAQGTLALLKAHLAKKGFKDIEVNMTGGYDPTTTSPSSTFVKAEEAVYKKMSVDPIIWPRLAGSWPGYIFTGPPLDLAAVQFGMGHGNGAHAPNEYYVIDSSNTKVDGYDGAARSHLEFMYEVASIT